MCLGLATGYREPTENKIDAELTNDDFLKALEYVKEYEQAIKEEQDFLKNGDEFHVEALRVCEIVKQALEKQIPKKVELWNNQASCPNCKTLMGNIGDIQNYKKYCDCGQALERLKLTKDYLRECFQNDLKNCKYPEIKPLIKDTYEDNKQAFDIAIKAIEDYNRQQAELEEARIGVKSYKGKYESAVKTAKELQTLVDEKQAEINRLRVKCEKRTQEKLELGRIYTQKLKTAKSEAEHKLKELSDDSWRSAVMRTFLGGDGR